MPFEVISYFFEEHSLFLIHVLNLFILVTLILLFIFARQTRKKWTKYDDFLGILTNTVNSIRYGDLSKKIDKMDIPSSVQLTESLNRMIESLNDREKMITEYQNELHNQNKFLEAVFNSLSDGLIVVDDEYKILRATHKISEWFGVSLNEIAGKDIFDFILLPKGLKLEKLKDNDVFVKSDKASNFIASTMELKLEDKNKRFILILKNVTNERELESLKEDFVATLTHDLKVPIIAETNMLELFLNESFGIVTDKQRTALKNMQASNKELLDLVQIVLETYKV